MCGIIFMCLLAGPSGNTIHNIAAKYVHINIAVIRKLEKMPIKAHKAEMFFFSAACGSSNRQNISSKLKRERTFLDFFS